MSTLFIIPSLSELSKTCKFVQDLKARKTNFLAKMSLRLISEDIARNMESAAQRGVGEVFVSRKTLHQEYLKHDFGILRRLSAWAEQDPATWEGYAEILGLDLGSGGAYENCEQNLFGHVYSPESVIFDRIMMEELISAYLSAGYSVSHDPACEEYTISGW